MTLVLPCQVELAEARSAAAAAVPAAEVSMSAGRLLNVVRLTASGICKGEGSAGEGKGYDGRNGWLDVRMVARVRMLLHFTPRARWRSQVGLRLRSLRVAS